MQKVFWLAFQACVAGFKSRLTKKVLEFPQTAIGWAALF
jgi:hypothetical protein